MGRVWRGFTARHGVVLVESHSSAYCPGMAGQWMILLLFIASIPFVAMNLCAASITDAFTDGASWNAPFAEAGKNLVVTNGRMNFTSSTIAGGGGGIARTAPSLTTTQDWSIKVDVHVNPFVITNEDHGVSVFLGVGKTSDWLGTHVLLGFDRDWWDPNYYGVNDDVQVNGASVPGFFNVNLLPSADATLRLDYNAGNQTITYYCDSDGSAGGGGWTTLGTTNIASGTYNLQLSPTDTLSVILAGWSEGHVVTNGQAYFDNLEITIASAEYAPDSIAGYTVAGTITNVNGTLIPPASATNVFGMTTFSQVGPNADNTYSGNYTYVKTGTNTGTIFVYKTAPPDQAGETTTNYLVFSNPVSGVFAHYYDFVDTPPTVQYGTFQVVQTNGLLGALQVTITPVGAVSAGAQWQVDGGAWQNSGSVVGGLSVGNHTVVYNSVPGWNTPSSQGVNVSGGVTTVTNGTYTSQIGSLEVTIFPAGAVSAGAQWQVDGGAWRNSGSAVGDLPVGNHTVSYKSVAGWNTPGNQTVVVVANATTITNATYAAQTGSLQVTISPAGAISAGAQWQVDGGAWQNSGAVVGGLSLGYHPVVYKVVAGWNPPANQTVVVVANTTVSTNGVYATNDYIFTTNNGAITITGYAGPGGAISIPASINGLPVVNIGNSAFQFKNVTTAIIPNTVTNIGALAFYYCTSLTNVSIPNGVIAIGYYGFHACWSLPNIHIPSSVLSIGDNAFGGTFALTSITVDGGNPNFTAVSGVLFNKNQTVLIQFPPKKIGPYVIPAATTNIGTGAFYGCAGLTNLNIPASVNSIGFIALAGKTSLTNITVDDANANFSSLAGVLCNKSQTKLIQYPTGRIGHYVVPNTITNIGTWAFTYCNTLTGVTIPSSVSVIEGSAFSSCIGLSSVIIPDSVSSLGSQTFGYCSGLTNVTLSKVLTNIVAFTFEGCTGLKSIAIPASVRSIDNYAFQNCSLLAGVFFHGNAPTLGGSSVFLNANTAIVYYLPGATGWGATYGGRPTVLWNPAPQARGPSFGIGTNRFGFTITGSAGIPIVVEAGTDLNSGLWTPLLNGTLTNGSIYFSDPQWTNYPRRYYRLRSP